MLAGCLLVLRPFASETLVVVVVAVGLAVAAGAEMVQGTRDAPARWILGGLYLAGAAILLAWPHIPLMVVGVVVGFLLLATGMLEVWSGLISAAPLPSLLVGAATGGLSVALITGVATLAFGLVAGLWVDAVMIPAALMLGTRLLLVGVGLLVDLWYPPTGFGAPTERQRATWRLVALVLAAGLILVGINLDGVRPSPSGFYASEVPEQIVPGRLVRATSLDAASDTGVKIRLLYATTDAQGSMRTASGLLYVPRATAGDSLPLVVWVHGETGVAASCAPSVIGEGKGGLGVADQLVGLGYAVFVPDGPGLGAPGAPSALLGQAGGRAILDGIRAVGQVPGVRLGASAIWGFSQGSHAALWAGQIAATYAPEVSLVGVAVDAPIFDPAAVVADQVTRQAPTLLPTYVLTSYAEEYPDVQVSDYLTVPEQLRAAEVAARCGSVGWAVDNWAAVVGARGEWSVPPASGALGSRLSQNAVGILPLPVLVTQGAEDQIVSSALTDVAVAGRCHAGQVVEYHRYAGVSHQSPATADAPQLGDSLAWLSARFAGLPAVSTCG